MEGGDCSVQDNVDLVHLVSLDPTVFRMGVSEASPNYGGNIGVYSCSEGSYIKIFYRTSLTISTICIFNAVLAVALSSGWGGVFLSGEMIELLV